MTEATTSPPLATASPVPVAGDDVADAAGLTDAAAARLLEAVGANEPSPAEPPGLARQFATRLSNPLVAILFLSSVAAAVVGDYVNASIVFLLVACSVVIEFVQTRRSARASDALRDRVAQTAQVRRNGAWTERPRMEVVPGDVVRLAAGDMVPADGRLLSARDFHVNEAALTGESLPIEKESGATVLMGSSVVSGNATAMVTVTGERTAFGAIARTLASHPPVSEFERGIVRFGVFILKTVIFLVLFVFLVATRTHRDPLQALLFGVALAVGLTPEFLPMITTVTLTRGAVRMARKNVIVKNLAAIQNLGSIDVLCSDKTGTLTTGAMHLDVHVDPVGDRSERPLLLGYLNSYFESGVDDPADRALLRKARLNPLDSAVLSHEHPDISGFTKVDEIPFDFERRRVSVVAARGSERLLVTKGAVEHVLSVCVTCEIDGVVRALDDAARARAAAAADSLGRRGHRVIAVAYAALPARPAYSKADERELTLAGFLGFADPPRDDALAVLDELRGAGVTTKVLTGDSELAAVGVCESVGLAAPTTLLGSEIERMSDPALGHAAERTTLFARVSPSQKNRILRALRARGHVVGFLGDGINDAPSLHVADVGITVSGAVDVAREAADVILLEPGLEVILSGIVEGRRAFGNVMKYLLMGTSSNFGNMFSMAAASVFLPFLPMLPKQILLNNFLYDLAQITIPSDNVDAAFASKPRRWDIGLVQRFMLYIGPLSSLYDFLTFFVLLHVFHASPTLFRTGWFVESLATQTLVIFVIRTARSPFASRPSAALVASAVGVVVTGMLLPFLPLAGWLGFAPLPFAFFPFVAAATVTYLALVEVMKRAVLSRMLR